MVKGKFIFCLMQEVLSAVETKFIFSLLSRIGWIVVNIGGIDCIVVAVMLH